MARQELAESDPSVVLGRPSGPGFGQQSVTTTIRPFSQRHETCYNTTIRFGNLDSGPGPD